MRDQNIKIQREFYLTYELEQKYLLRASLDVAANTCNEREQKREMFNVTYTRFKIPLNRHIRHNTVFLLFDFYVVKMQRYLSIKKKHLHVYVLTF